MAVALYAGDPEGETIDGALGAVRSTIQATVPAEAAFPASSSWRTEYVCGPSVKPVSEIGLGAHAE
ncbi:MAG: hypothetical protein Q7V62_02210 [Actinomycetota bacterium]|nr:hypothetical protein [Actinomycetota bacterium]